MKPVRTAKSRTRMFLTNPARKGYRAGKRKATPTFWRGHRKSIRKG